MIVIVALVVLGVPVAVVVWLVRRHREDAAGDGTGHALRRALQYLFLLIALIAAANGVTRLVSVALPAGRRIAGPAATETALGLALTIVATPLWIVLWQVARRGLAQDPSERSSMAWALYMLTATTTALVVAFVNLVPVGTWVLLRDGFPATELATALVWGVVWGLHAGLIARSPVAPTGVLSQLVIIAGSAVGIIALAVGTAGVLSYALEQAYRAAAGPALVGASTTDLLSQSAVVTVLGAAVWWWHWLRRALHGDHTTPWYVFVVVAGVLGLGFASGATVLLLFSMLQWAIGDPVATRAVAHFSATPGAVAVLAVGGWAWRYHHMVLTEAPSDDGEPERAYGYLVAGVGLAVATAGATVALVAFIGTVAPAPLAVAGLRGGDAVALAVPLLAVGAPLWWQRWHGLQQGARAGAVAELRSPSRRAYLLVLFGVSGLTAAISGVVILYVIFRDLLEGVLSSTAVYDLRVAIALVVTMGGISASHWAVQRADRAAGPPPVPRRQVLLVTFDGVDLAAAVAQRTGARVRTLHRLDVTATAIQVDPEAITAAILEAPRGDLLVTVEGDGSIRAIPYERG